MRGRLGAAPALAMAACVSGACELEEITLVEVEAVVVAEIYVNLASDPERNEVRAFLHRTVGSDTAGLAPLSAARITILRPNGGAALRLAENPLGDCVGSSPEQEVGVCFLADPSETPTLRHGELLEVQVELADGGRLSGATRVPARFELDRLSGNCRLDPNTVMPVRWSRSESAWAYVNETSIRGLPDALRPEGIEVDEDPLYLLGLSISDRDTTIAFPSEFGVFNRFELDQDVAVRLQAGLPAATTAEVTITAVDRNFVNWARGGTFNPSGQVRVPSLQGDGTGVFAATVGRRFVVISERPPHPVDDCPVPQDDTE